MIWRWRYGFWKILELKPTSYYPVKRPFLSSIHYLAAPIDKHKNLESFSAKIREENLGRSSKTIVLCSKIVQTTLVNCPSDLLALSFFLWCARQPDFFHDRLAFEHMVPVVSRLTQRFLSVRGILDELKRVGCVIKPQTLLHLLRIFWYGKMYELVFEAFEEMDRCGYTPNTFARNIILDVLFKIGCVDEALEFLEESKVPNFLTFSIAVCNLCKLKDLIKLSIVLRSTLRYGYSLNPETFLTVLNCYCKLGRLNEALQLLGLMIILGLPASVNVWSVLIDGFCKAGWLDIAGNLLDKMVETGCSPNVVTCTSLIKGFLESERVSEALRIFHIMKSKGYYPDLVLSNVLIDCLSKVGRFAEALYVFNDLQKRRLIPDPYTFSSIVSMVCSSRKFSLLPLLISGLVIEPDSVVFNSLLSYFCKADYPTGAVEFYNDMIEGGFQPDKYSYAGLLSGLCKSGRIREALNVYRAIVQNHLGLDTHIHTIIMDGLIKNGNFHMAIKLFRRAAAENVPLDVVSYTVAINGLLRGNQAREAYSLFRQMKDIGIVPNIHTYNLILSGFCKDRNDKMIKEILQEMSDMRVEMDNNTLKLMKTFLLKSHTPTALDQFVELGDSGLLPERKCALPSDELSNNAIGDGVHSNTMKLQDVGASSSDEYCGLAALVG